MPDLAEFTVKELNDEIARRVAEKERLRTEKHKLRADTITKTLTRELIDGLVPEHSRTSCSDDNLVNGIRDSIYSHRCTRCALLIAYNDGYWPHQLNLTLRIETYDGQE